MTDMPETTYIVSAFEKPHWRTVLTTKDKDKAEALVEEIGSKVRIVAFSGPTPARRCFALGLDSES